jgi:hypothetical protein
MAIKTKKQKFAGRKRRTAKNVDPRMVDVTLEFIATAYF